MSCTPLSSVEVFASLLDSRKAIVFSRLLWLRMVLYRNDASAGSAACRCKDAKV